MTAKHFPATIWPTRDVWRWGRQSGPTYQVVSTEDETTLKLSFFPGNGASGISVKINRRDARLLARRIVQCLEATK